MVLLRGRNYDYSGEITAKLTQGSMKGNTSLYITNTTGLSQDDFIVINPKTIYAEIVQITATPEDSKLTITPLKFNHMEDAFVYRISFNKMKFYGAPEKGGPYTEIATSETEMNYTDNYTNYSYDGSHNYFKRTFYNSETSVESDIDEGDEWTTKVEDLIITEQEMRSFLQFETDDWPSANDIRFFINIGTKRLMIDTPIKRPDVLFIAALLISKVYILRALGTKAIAKGYIQVNAEGRVITKAYQEIVLEAERVNQEYKEFLVNVGRREATSTNFFKDTDRISNLTRQDIIDRMNGTTNAENQDLSRKYSYFWGRR